MRRFEFVPKNFPKPQDDDGEIGGAITTCLEIPMKLPIEGPLDGCVQSEKTEGPPPTVNVLIMDSYVALSTVSNLGGVYTWPCAISLSCYIYSQWALFKQTLPRVVEIGAGTGLPGLVAASFGSKVTLTDGDDAALKRLEENVMKNSLSIPCEVLKLHWGEFQSESVYLDADIVLGADIIYEDWHMEVVAMTVAWLLRGKQCGSLKGKIEEIILSRGTPTLFLVGCDLPPTIVKTHRIREFWLAYHNRGGSRSLRPYLEKWGMNGEQEIPRESYLPDELLLNPNYLSVSVLRFCVPCE